MTRIVLLAAGFLAGFAYCYVSLAYALFPVPQKRWLVERYHDWRGGGSEDPLFAKTVYKLYGREAVDCQGVLAGKRAAVLLTFGQSNSQNVGVVTGFRPSAPVYNFNVHDGRCYKAVDPLLGAVGPGGSPWGRLGQRLVDDGTAEVVMLVPVGGDGSVTGWAGQTFPRVAGGIERARKAGLTITHILYHQGETEGTADMPTADYRGYIHSIVRQIRATGETAPFYVAVTSGCQGRRSESVRQAQLTAADPELNIRRGPDTDVMGLIYRPDGCHFSDWGLGKHADLWADILGKSWTP